MDNSVTTIKAAKGVGASRSRYRRLSPLDSAVRTAVVGATWIYAGYPDISELKASLSKLLSHYVHLPGRMAGLENIRLNNQGVHFHTGTDFDLRVDDLDRDYSLEHRIVPPFSVLKMLGGISPLMTVKATTIQDGTAISIKVSHACLDGFSAFTMMQDWGRICRGLSIDPPVLDQNLLPTPEGRNADELNRLYDKYNWRSASLSHLLMLGLRYIDKSTFNRSRPHFLPTGLVNTLRLTLEQRRSRRVSTNTLVTAIVAKWCVETIGYDRPVDVTLNMVIDGRNRVSGIGSKFIGNLALIHSINLGKVERLSIAEIVENLEQGLAPMRSDGKASRHSADELLSLTIDTATQGKWVAPWDISAMVSRTPHTYSVNSFGRFPIYDVDFGAGPPKRMIPPNMGYPIVILPAPPEQDGIDVYFGGLMCELMSGQKADSLRKFTETLEQG